MRVDPTVVQEVASEVVMQLILDGAIRVSPSRVDAVERQLATVMRLALLREDALRRVARLGRELGDEGFDSRVRPYARMLRGVPEGGRGFLSVVEAMVALLRRSADVSEVRDSDDDLVRKILSLIARPSRPKRRSFPSGGSGPAGAGPAGGLPAEVRAWEVPRGEDRVTRLEVAQAGVLGAYRGEAATPGPDDGIDVD
jgi:hypothetical protein